MSFQGGKSSAANVMDWSVGSAYKALKDIEPKSIETMEVENAIIPVLEGSSDKLYAVLASKPRKKTMTSVFLKYFESAPDGKSRKCRFCGQSYSIATATGNLGRHLGNRHPGYDKVEDLSNPNSYPESVTLAKRPSPHVKSSKVEVEHLNWLLIKWFALASLPPSAVEETWLTNSFRFLNPSVKLWPEERFAAVLREVHRSMQEDVRAIVDQVSSKASITLDFWTSYEEILYMSITCQWIDDNWSFQKVLLDVCRIPFPFSNTEVYHALVKVLKSYSIDDRVISCTYDSTRHAKNEYPTLKDDMDVQKIGPFCYLPCAAHTLNSIINDGLDDTKAIISKIRELALEMNTNSQISDDFLQLTSAYQEGSWKFPLDTSARWSGNCQMLDIARKAGKSMETIIRKYEEPLGSRLLLSTPEKNAVNIMHTYLEPFYKTINNICTSKVLTVGLVLFFMDHILEMIAACRDSRHSPDWLKTAAEKMSIEAHNYSGQINNVFSYMTAILDPRIKVDLIPDNLNSENHLEEARSHFMRNYSTSHFQSLTSSYAAAQELEDGGAVSFAEEIARKKRRASMSSVTDELTQYLSEPLAPIPTDALDWWKVNSSRYPRLSMMARDFLAVQGTAVAPEDLFCSKGDKVYMQRFSTPHDSTQPLQCIRSWVQGGIKLKYKSTEIDYERLMELAGASAGYLLEKHIKRFEQRLNRRQKVDLPFQ